MLDMKGNVDAHREIDLHDYAKYVLREGSNEERRELLGCFKSVLGSLTRSARSEIWHSPRVKAARYTLASLGEYPSCSIIFCIWRLMLFKSCAHRIGYSRREEVPRIARLDPKHSLAFRPFHIERLAWTDAVHYLNGLRIAVR